MSKKSRKTRSMARVIARLKAASRAKAASQAQAAAKSQPKLRKVAKALKAKPSKNFYPRIPDTRVQYEVPIIDRDGRVRASGTTTPNKGYRRNPGPWVDEYVFSNDFRPRSGKPNIIAEIKNELDILDRLKEETKMVARSLYLKRRQLLHLDKFPWHRRRQEKSARHSSHRTRVVHKACIRREDTWSTIDNLDEGQESSDESSADAAESGHLSSEESDSSADESDTDPGHPSALFPSEKGIHSIRYLETTPPFEERPEGVCDELESLN